MTDTTRATGVDYRFEAIGAPWRISTVEPLDAQVTDEIAARIERFDRTYSRFRKDSLVSRIARTPGSWQFPSDAPPLFALYRTLYEATGGALSPLVGERLLNLGYDRSYSLTADPVAVRVPSWDDAVAWNGHTLTTVRPVLLDVGAAGKGYLVDLVAGILAEAGIDQYVVDASGDLVHRGPTPLRVGLEDPRNPRRAIGVYSLQNAALCASASNRRVWGSGLHHILDALTGEPTRAVTATWAIVPATASPPTSPGPASPPTSPALPTMLADGLATGLFFRGAGSFASAPGGTGESDGTTDNAGGTTGNGSRASFTFQYVRMFADATVEYSRDLQGKMFT